MSKNIEIERKFLVKGDFMPFVTKQYEIKQGYISTDPTRTVRIRTKGETGYITVKGEPNENGFSRFEWERKISNSDACQMLTLCKSGIIEKVRYEVEYREQIFEVDVFEGDNIGLIVAELELEEENKPYFLPDWIGEDVTNDIRYYNSYLSQHPFSEW